MTIQTKSTAQHYSVELFIVLYKVNLSFETVDDSSALSSVAGFLIFCVVFFRAFSISKQYATVVLLVFNFL